MTSRILSLATVLALAACGGGSGGPADRPPTSGSPPGSGGTPAGSPSQAPVPVVIATTPTQDQTGVPDDVTLVLEFSEPMDRASVEAAYRSETLGEVWFAWTSDDKALTITPVELLAYAEGLGTEPWEIDARAYDLRIGAEATSREGVPLGVETSLHFTTYRRMAADFGIDPDLTGHITDYQWLAIWGGAPIRVGDLQVNDSMRGVVTFDLADLPSSTEVVETAIWSARQLDAVGDGTVDPEPIAYHVQFDQMDMTAFLGFPFSMVGPYSDAEGTSVVHDVTDKVQADVDDRQARGDRSQYRIQFDGDSDGDGVGDYFEYDANAMTLSVIYLAH